MANHINKGQLGETRLSNIHPRVEYFMYQDVDDDNLKEFYYKPLCKYCEMKLYMSGRKAGDDVEVTPNCKTLFIQCSGVGWLCRARQRLINTAHIHWECHGQMKTKKIYNMILLHIMKTQQPKDAVYNIEHFNLAATKKMPHLMKTTHLAEYLIYSNYIPFKLTKEMFPALVIGKEYIDAYVPPLDIFKEESDETDQYGWTPSAWKEELAEKCKNIAKNPSKEKEFFEKILDEICKYELYDDILHAIHKLPLANDPCFHCVWLKHKLPGKIINCTGIPKLCSMKYELFNAWPPEFYKDSQMMTRIVMCDTLQRYAHFMNEIFNVKFIERAM